MKGSRFSFYLLIGVGCLLIVMVVVRLKNAPSVVVKVPAVSAPAAPANSPETTAAVGLPKATQANNVVTAASLNLPYRGKVSSHRIDTPCSKEYERICRYPGGYMPNEAQKKCMSDSLPRFSQACQDFVAMQKSGAEKIISNCADDIKTFCSNFKGPAALCLGVNQSKLSVNCAKVITQAMPKVSIKSKAR